MRDLEDRAEVNWVQATRDMADASACEETRESIAVISSLGTPYYSREILDGCHELSLLVRIGAP